MAPKKKTTDDIKKAKAEIGEGARAVGKAAENLLKVPMSDEHYRNEWGQTVSDVDSLDREFSEEASGNLMDYLRSKLQSGDTEVRVMQIGPDGRLTDVSDRVKPKDLGPEHVRGVQIEDGKTVPFGRNPQSREVAYQALRRILPELGANNGKSESLRRMEKILEESDQILEHWKK